MYPFSFISLIIENVIGATITIGQGETQYDIATNPLGSSIISVPPSNA